MYMVSNYNYIEWYGIRILSIRWGAARKDDNKLISFFCNFNELFEIYLVDKTDWTRFVKDPVLKTIWYHT